MHLIFFFLFVFNSHAWSPEFISQWDQTNRSHAQKISGAKFATFWGGIRRAIYWPHHQGKIEKIKPNEFRKSLPVYLNFSKHKKDLVLFYPGVFGLADGEVTPVIIDKIEKRDKHVAVIPNITSSEYQLAKRIGVGDPFLEEGKNQKLIFEKIIETIGRENIDRVHIISESLGCFQVMSGLVNQSFVNLEISSITLMWPPLYLDRAVKRFDDLINESKTHLGVCRFWWKWPGVIFQTKFQEIPDLDNEDKSCLGSLVIGRVFVNSIEKNSQLILGTQKNIPNNFSSFVKTVLPEIHLAVQNRDERFSLSYQLTKMNSMKDRINFISSKDDFLNDPSEWNRLKENYPDLSKRLFLFNWGGHSGPVGLEGLFDSILKERVVKR
jgi:hypothetical protein